MFFFYLGRAFTVTQETQLQPVETGHPEGFLDTRFSLGSLVSVEGIAVLRRRAGCRGRRASNARADHGHMRCGVQRVG